MTTNSSTTSASSTNQVSETLPSVPQSSTWPGAFAAYKYSRESVKVNIWPFLTVLLLYVLISIGVGELDDRVEQPINFLLSPFFSILTALIWLAGIRRIKLSLSEAFRQSLPFYIRILVLQVLVSLAYLLSLLALVIPFFFVLPRLLLAPYLLIDKDIDIMDAFKGSWNMTKGHAMKVWGIIGVTILMALLMVTIIGIPLAIYLLIMYSAAPVILYAWIDRQNTPLPTPTPGATTRT